MNNLINLYMYEHGTPAGVLKFETIIVILAIICFITYSFDKTYTFVVIIIVFALWIGNSYVGIRSQLVTDDNKTTMIKLQTIQSEINEIVNSKVFLTSMHGSINKRDLESIKKRMKMDYLYIDADLIHFIHSIIPVAQYNQQEFFSFVNGVNTILKIKHDIDVLDGEVPENISEMLESAIQLKSNTLNNLHNFIYSVPKISKMYTYISKVLDRYNILISRNIDYIHAMYKQNIHNNGINSNTKFVTYNTTKPFDAISNHSIIPNKSSPNSLYPISYYI